MKQTILKLAVFGMFLVLSITGVAIKAQKKSTDAQKFTSEWQIFSPPDNTFSIELPGKPYHTKNPDPGPNGVEDKWFLDLFECTKKVDFFVLPITTGLNSDNFVIEIYDVSRCKRKPELFDKEIEGQFSWMGGDNKKVLLDASSKVSGRAAREMISTNGEGNGGHFLAVDDGKTIYLLTYQTEKMNDDIDTKMKIDRIFKSFRLK